MPNNKETENSEDISGINLEPQKIKKKQKNTGEYWPNIKTNEI